MVRRRAVFTALVLTLVLLGIVVARNWRAGRTAAQRVVPTDIAFLTGHTLRTGARAEILAFVDTGCDTCAALFTGFQQEADAAPDEVRFAVVPYPGTPSVRAQVRALAIECAAIEERAGLAMQLIFQEQEPLRDLHVFAAKIGQRNVTDFVSCVEEERFRFIVERNARLATDDSREGFYIVRAPDPIGQMLRVRLDSLFARIPPARP